MPTLNQTQIDSLQAKLNNSQIYDFYSELSGYGDTYATAALGITDNSTFIGKLANTYLSIRATAKEIDMSHQSAAWTQLNLGLATGHLNAYIADPTGPTYQQIIGIHHDVYERNGLGQDDWILNRILTASQDPAQSFTDFIGNNVSAVVDDVQHYFETTSAQNDALLSTITLEGMILLGPSHASFFNSGTDTYLLPIAGSLAVALTLESGEAVGNLIDFAGEKLDPKYALLAAYDNLILNAQSIAADGRLIPSWMVAGETDFEIAASYHCPLVLDLGAAGIVLKSVTTDAVYWDIDNDGFREASGWVGAEDGLLAIDLNEDGKINDHSELFGTSTANGFSILAQYDSNSDNSITSSDTDFGRLIVWVDANSDGFSQSDELRTLTDLGITSISLSASTVSYSLAGNPVTAQATFVLGGNTRQIVSADFAFDNVNSIYDHSYQLNPAALFLPDLRGYGRIADLHVAMSQNEELLDQVSTLSNASLEDLLDPGFETTSKISNILFAWAGVEDLSPTGRGGNTADDRSLEFMEELFDQEYLQAGRMLETVPLGGMAIDQAFTELSLNLTARLFSQTALGKLLQGNIYNPITDTFSGFTGLNSDILDEVITLAGLSSDPIALWQQVVRLIEGSIGVNALSGGDETALATAIDNTSTGTLIDILASIHADEPTVYNGTSSAETLTGGFGNDQLFGFDGNDILNGGSGLDQLNGGRGDDTLAGGADNDALFGGEGNDTYIYGGGQDNIDEVDNASSALDTLVLGAGIGVADVTMERVDGDNLRINIAGGGRILVFDQFDHNRTVERLVFDDGTVIDLTAIQPIVTGTSGNDTLSGLDNSIFPHDLLRGLDGADTLSGGNGNDILEGGAGNDTYLVTDGYDVVRDTNGTDIVQFDSNYDKNLISYNVINGADLQILFDGVPAVLIEKQFGPGTTAVETLKFSDNSTITLSSVAFTQTGTAANDVLYGLESGASTNDTIYGGAGNDTLVGGSGNDTLDGDLGNDTLNGDLGNDTFIVNGGYDTIRDTGGTDTISFGVGYDINDMQLKRLGDSDLQILFNGTPAVRLQNFFLNGSYGVETLTFPDTSTFDLTPYHNVIGTTGTDTLSGLDNTALEDDFIYGYGGVDTLSGGDGNDALFGGDGNDTLTGGAGNDRLEGGSGDDTYFYSGDIDTVSDVSGSADKIEFDTGYDLVDMSLVRSGDSDLSIRFNGVEAVLIKGQFANTGAIETLEFSDSSTLDLSTVSYGLEGTEGNDSLYGIDRGGAGDIINGNAGNDTLYGYGGNDVLNGGDGNDSLQGGDGNDEYQVNSDGDTITDTNGTDKIVFGSAYDPMDLTLVRNGQYNLELRFNGTLAATISNQFGQNAGIETLEFSDTSTLDLTILQYTLTGTSGGETIHGLSFGGNPNDIIYGGDGADTLYGYNGDDTLYGENGNDTLNGGAGDDLYVYSAGTDKVIDSGGTDMVQFGSGYLQANMTLQKVNGSDLKISFSGVEALTIQGHFNAGGGIETLKFFDNSTYSLANFRNIINGTTGVDTLNGSSSSTIVDALYANDGNDTINANAGDDFLYGENGTDTLNGGDGNDTLDGGAGNDSLVGGNGDDTYIFSAGTDTITEPNGSGGGNDALKFSAGITLADLTLYRQADASSGVDKLYIADQSGNVTIVLRQFPSSSPAQIEKLIFADGTEVLLTSLDIPLYGTSSNDTLNGVASGADIDDSIYGYAGNDTINGSTGNDYIDGGTGNDTMSGGTGDDTYVFETGFASASAGVQDTVTESASSGTDKIVFKGGILPEQIRSWLGSDGAMYLQVNGSSTDIIKITGSNALTGSDIVNRLEQIVFEGITTWDLTQGLRLIDQDVAHSVYGSGQNDYIDGRAGNDTLYGHAGNDTLIGGAGYDIMNGGTGDDTFIFAPGFGIAATSNTDVVNENASEGTDTIRLQGVNPDGIRLWIDTGGDVYIRYLSDANDQLYLNASASSGSDVGSRFEKIVFDDGTEWNLASGIISTGLDTGQSMIGTAYDDVVDGRAGNDTITTYAGNDTLIGGTGTDTLVGGTGNDTYIFGSGFGAGVTPDTVTESISEGTDTIRITGGLDASDIQTWIDGSYYYLNLFGSSTDTLRVAITNGATGADIGSRIEKVQFDDGTYLDMTSGALLNDTDDAHTVYGTAQNDIIYGNGGNDTLNGVNGNDTIHGGDGTDTISGGEGADILYGDDGVDTITGGNGNDTIYGGAGADSLNGNAGADTFVFMADTAFGAVDNITGFSTGDGDKLNLADLLIDFDPMTDVITDFVSLSVTSGHTTFAVDRDGTGTSYSSQNVTTLLSTTGLNVSTMFANGNIIATDD